MRSKLDYKWKTWTDGYNELLLTWNSSYWPGIDCSLFPLLFYCSYIDRWLCDIADLRNQLHYTHRLKKEWEINHILSANVHTEHTKLLKKQGVNIKICCFYRCMDWSHVACSVERLITTVRPVYESVKFQPGFRTERSLLSIS